MNYLAHLYFSIPTPASRTGNLLGDFTRGLQEDNLPGSVLQGLQNHRSIDVFTDGHPINRALRGKFGKARRRVAGIILDVVYDHFLIRRWNLLHSQDMDTFLTHACNDLEAGRGLMPEHMRYVPGHMCESRWLKGYRTLEGVIYALDRMSMRTRAAAALKDSGDELQRLYPEIEAAFDGFYPDLMQHVQREAIEGWNPPLRPGGRIN